MHVDMHDNMYMHMYMCMYMYMHMCMCCAIEVCTGAALEVLHLIAYVLPRRPHMRRDEGQGYSELAGRVYQSASQVHHA